MTGISAAAAAAAYARGIDPLTYAESLLIDIIGTHLAVADVGAYHNYPIEPGIDPLARRILGELLDAGWSAPVVGGQGDDQAPAP